MPRFDTAPLSFWKDGCRLLLGGSIYREVSRFRLVDRNVRLTQLRLDYKLRASLRCSAQLGDEKRNTRYDYVFPCYFYVTYIKFVFEANEVILGCWTNKRLNYRRVASKSEHVIESSLFAEFYASVY